MKSFQSFVSIIPYDHTYLENHVHIIVVAPGMRRALFYGCPLAKDSANAEACHDGRHPSTLNSLEHLPQDHYWPRGNPSSPLLP
jgi:hypothetical protein